MNYINIESVTGAGIVLIDKDTGTVLGNNVVMAYVPSNLMEEVLESDTAAIAHGEVYGIPLFVEERLDD